MDDELDYSMNYQTLFIVQRSEFKSERAQQYRMIYSLLKARKPSSQLLKNLSLNDLLTFFLVF